jgi:mRNA-degrading endonuclease toxin of MazEF toxin-antitoxin module
MRVSAWLSAPAFFALLPTVAWFVRLVEFDYREPFTGRAVCDDIETLWPGEVTRNLGALTPEAMSRVEDGLRAALDL